MPSHSVFTLHFKPKSNRNIQSEEPDKDGRITRLSLFVVPFVDFLTFSRKTINVNSGFRREVDIICTLLGFYAPQSDNSLPTFRDNTSVPYLRVKKSKKDFLTLEDGTDRLSRKVCKELSLYAG